MTYNPGGFLRPAAGSRRPLPPPPSRPERSAHVLARGLAQPRRRAGVAEQLPARPPTARSRRRAAPAARTSRTTISGMPPVSVATIGNPRGTPPAPRLEGIRRRRRVDEDVERRPVGRNVRSVAHEAHHVGQPELDQRLQASAIGGEDLVSPVAAEDASRGWRGTASPGSATCVLPRRHGGDHPDLRGLAAAHDVRLVWSSDALREAVVDHVDGRRPPTSAAVAREAMNTSLSARSTAWRAGLANARGRCRARDRWPA